MRALTLAALMLAFGLATAPATACTLVVSTGGTLGLNAAGDTFGSQEGSGTSALVLVSNLTLSPVTVTVAAPTLVSAPGGFSQGGAMLQVAYAGGGVLSSVSRSYTASQTSFSVPALLGAATALTVNNRILSTSGFSSGTYQTRTVLTCS